MEPLHNKRFKKRKSTTYFNEYIRMETTTKKDLKAFRFETRQWLETHCPKSMRTPLKDSADYYWGGSNPTFSSEDQNFCF